MKNPFRYGGIVSSDSIIENIFSITEGHPYYTQMICDILWDSCEPVHGPLAAEKVRRFPFVRTVTVCKSAASIPMSAIPFSQE